MAQTQICFHKQSTCPLHTHTLSLYIHTYIHTYECENESPADKGASFCSHLRRHRVYELPWWKVLRDTRCIYIVLVY